MEIDIPSLDDVEFETACGRCYWDKTKTDCQHCRGTRTVLTEVGQKLVKFLEARGVRLAPLSKEE